MTNLSRLFKYLKKYKGLVGLNILSNILMSIFIVVSIPAIIPFLQILFDRAPEVMVQPEWSWSMDALVENAKYQFSQMILKDGKEHVLVITCVLIIVLFFLKNLFRYLSLFFMSPVRNGIVRDIRQQLFDHMMALPLSFFSQERKGDLMARITADVQEIEYSILHVLEVIFREPIVIVGCLTFMLYVSPPLTMFVFVLIIFTVFIIGGIGKTLKKKSAIAQTKLGDLVAIIDEGLSGHRIIKGFNAEGYQKQKFATENNSYKDLLTRIYWRRELSSPLSEFLGIAIVAILLWYGSRQVFANQLSPETFFAFLFAFYNVIAPAKSFSSAFYNIQKGLAAVDRVDEILATPLTITDKKDARSIDKFNKTIQYQQVGFHYDDDEKIVLKNFSLKISKGSTIALVGASGAGKSTVADLLARFYDVKKGSILIDGIDIRDYKVKDLRSLLGIVSQEAILFNDSIYNNIVFGLKNVSETDVIHAAKVANAHDFILATEHGYQTNIGDRGNKLSGGQRQRITIARAILKNPPILILDEATSALDVESEKLVQQALFHLMQNRTAIVIAHRLSTIQHADEILVMNQGEIVERGEHQELINQKGAYWRLVGLQGGYE